MLSAQRLSPKTVRNACGLLTATLSLFLPAFRPRITLPVKKHVKLYRRPLTTSWNSTRAQTTRICAVQSCSALSAPCVGEICALEYSNIRGDSVTINRALVLDEHREWQLKAPKTYSSYCTIKLPPYILAAIDAPTPRTRDGLSG